MFDSAYGTIKFLVIVNLSDHGTFLSYVFLFYHVMVQHNFMILRVECLLFFLFS